MLRRLFGLESTNNRPSLPRRIRYATFRVDNEEAATALYNWHKQREEALKVVQEFVVEHFDGSLMKLDKPLFKLDENGKLESVLFSGVTPLGWCGIPDTNWLAPESPEAMRAVEALPPVAPPKELHKIIDWPTLEIKWFHRSEHETVHRINHMVRPYGDAHATYIVVPHYSNFEAFPRIYEMIANWQPPAWLKEIGPGGKQPGPNP